MQYTSVYTLGDNILYRGIENGQRRFGKFKYQPSLFVSSPKKTGYVSINEKNLGKLDFESLREAKNFIEKYKGVDNFEIFGNQSFEYSYISDMFPGTIDWKFEDIVIANIDIEVGSENGFPDVETAAEVIQAITVRKRGKTYAFGFNVYKAPPDVLYMQCEDEVDLIEQFLSFWQSDYPDVITGWYVKLFDIPYLVNRIIKLFGEDKAQKLSPWNILRKREIKFGRKISYAHTLYGIATLDYIELYKKFAPEGKSKESYKLDYVCNVELGEKKLSYQEYGNLHTLYKENFQLFMDYNVRDTYLVEKLDGKLKLLQLAFKLAYHSKCNFDDVFMQTRMWDSLICNHLTKENIILPAKQSFEKEEYAGAWVKEPIIGKHKWVVSFDFTSLYPKLMMQYNLSNDTILSRKDWPADIVAFMEQDINVDSLLNRLIDTSILKKYNLALTPNKQLYKRNKEGFLPKILRGMFNDRQMYKSEMKKAKKKLEAGVNNKEELENQIAMFDCFQQAIKVCINSCYGALGNQFFRLFDVRIAEAVTLSGQLAIHWVIQGINKYLNKLFKTKDMDYVIAADTDSMYIVLDKLVQAVFGDNQSDTVKILDFLHNACEKQISPYIDKCCIDLADYTNAFANEMEMKREKLCDLGIIVAKKRYIWNVWDNEGVRYTKPKVSVVGLETKRSNVPQWAKNKLIESIDYIIAGDQAKVHALVKASKPEFMNLSIEDIATPTGMNGIATYMDKQNLYKKGTPIHIKASIIYNEYLERKGLTKKYPKIQEGEKVKYVYLKYPNPIHDEVIAFSNVLPPEFALNLYVDYDRMFNKVFQEPLKAILDVVGWTLETRRSLF